MNILNTTFNGGEPIYLDDIRWNDTAYRNAMNGILQAFGNNFIVQGCTPSTPSFIPGTTTITSGYIMLNGQLLQVDASSSLYNNYYSLVITYNPSGQDTYYTGTTHNVYQQNRGVANSGSGSLNIYGPRLNGIILTTSNIGSNSGQIPNNGSNLGNNLPIFTNGSGKLITSSLPTGTTTVAGILKIANSTDITNGTNTTKAVTPAQLAGMFNFDSGSEWVTFGGSGGYTVNGSANVNALQVNGHWIVTVSLTGINLSAGNPNTEYLIGTITGSFAPIFTVNFQAIAPTSFGQQGYFFINSTGNIYVNFQTLVLDSISGTITYVN